MSVPPAVVTVTQLPPGDYRKDCVALPRDYGSRAYEERDDVRAIREAVYDCLDRLEVETGISGKLRGRPALVKPNLVTVYHRMGLVEEDYPESADPRVLEAGVRWLQRYSSDIVIVESSGRGAPTRGSFRVAGLDRLARRLGCRLLPLEEQPVDRYFLPKAKVLKEALIPRIFRPVVEGEAFYLSLPKMKTNLYTTVTLGFKNAMGLLPYNLRQRNHNWALDQKLVDLLYLVRPDLTLVDGVVGGEGNCPAPVDPVNSRVLIAGNHPLETDRVAARLMGFNPEEVPLLRLAAEMGFAAAETVVLGEAVLPAFRPADPSLLSEAFARQFPEVVALVGRERRDGDFAPVIGGSLDPVAVSRMEMACRGGCLATARFAFEMILREGLSCDFRLVVVIGSGLSVEGERRWFDRSGRAFTREEIARLPGKKLAIGHCSEGLRGIVDRHLDGCMPFPNAPHMALHRLTGSRCRVLGLGNRQLPLMLLATLQTWWNRRRRISRGERLDVPLAKNDCLLEPGGDRFEICPPKGKDDQDWIRWPLPPLSKEEVREMLRVEDAATWSTLLGH
ncbi:MAG: DUF362 domain-containing protein [Coprothermobacterota bacterium]|nr:DUF362 domain-containing protein [Coprothermobacterota bacterium]